MSELDEACDGSDVCCCRACNPNGLELRVELVKTREQLRRANAQLELADAARAKAQEQWRCFHCGEVLTNEAEAREHFGPDYGWENGATPACKADQKLLRQLEDDLRAVQKRYEKQEIAAYNYDAQCAELERLFGKGRTSAFAAWQEYDSKEGERLAAVARAEVAEAAAREAKESSGLLDCGRARLGQLDESCDGCIHCLLRDKERKEAALAAMTKERDLLKADKQMLLRERKGEVWVWQGDPEEDHIESIGCPILIHSEDMKPLVAAEAQVAALEGRLQAIRDWVEVDSFPMVRRDVLLQMLRSTDPPTTETVK